MRLYHGTTSRFLPAIMQKGLLPRGRRRGNWSHTIESNPRAVYLTSAYPWHFAACSTKKTEPGLILEIDSEQLDRHRCCPDEDFLEQATRGRDVGDIGDDMKERTAYYRNVMRWNPEHFKTSLEYMGTATYFGPIPWRAVTQWAEIDLMKMNPHWRLRCVDSSVSILSYRYLKSFHEGFTRWLFGYPVPVEELFIGWEAMSVEQRIQCTKIAKDRAGIAVYGNDA